MERGRSFRSLAVPAAMLAAGLLLAGAPLRAATTDVQPGGDNLVRAIAAAAEGDTLQLAPGVHQGPVKIDRALSLIGEPGAIIDGGRKGRTVEVDVPGAVIRGLEIRGSGLSLEKMDAGVYLEQTATGAVVEDNQIKDNLVGVYVHGARDALVRGNAIAGHAMAHQSEAGNGVYVWNAPGAKVIGNDITGGRDGIFTNVSRENVFSGNRIYGVRFAVHYMYTNDSTVSDNISIGNHAGFVMMYSDRVTMRNNVSDGDRDHGLLFNYANESEIEGNAVLHGGEKCVFIYNANKNRFRGNWFEGCRIGIHFTAGSERNAMSGNAFINNRTQVMYVGTRFLDWSADGRGNYWSDNPAFDLNGDGIADEAYRPNDIVDQIVWRFPAAKLLLNSPAMQVVRWAQSQFPGLHPGGVVDGAPLMKPPYVPAAHYGGSPRPAPKLSAATP